MSTTRTPEEIQNQYVQLCTKAGDLFYKVASTQKDLDLVRAEMQKLNLEYAASVAAKAAADAQAASDSEKPAAPVLPLTKEEG